MIESSIPLPARPAELKIKKMGKSNFFIMSVLLLLLGMALDLHGQTDKKINIDVKYGSLNDVVKQIHDQTGYNFSSELDPLNPIGPFTMNMQGVTVIEILQKIITKHYYYDITQDTIIRINYYSVAKEAQNGDHASPSDKMIHLRGIVLDDKNNRLPGATVILKGTGKATQTDNNGMFLMETVPDNGIVTISCIGHQTKHFKYAGMRRLYFKLPSVPSEMNTVVIKGFYNTWKEFNTGNVTTVKGTDIQKQSIGNPLMAMAGRAPGVYVSEPSGVTGVAGKISIRGRNSLENGNDPLYVVDGVPYFNASYSQVPGAAGKLNPLVYIASDDIESISVLKDADGTAIYGSRGANGVILITTKKAVSGKFKVTCSFSRGIGKVARKLNIMTAAEYLAMREEAFLNDGTTPGPNDYDLNGTWSKIVYTDWQKALIGGTANTANKSISITGSIKQIAFSINMINKNEETVFPGPDINRTNFSRASMVYNSKDNRLKVTANVSFAENLVNLPQADLTQDIFMSPATPDIHDSRGRFNTENGTFQNPYLTTLKRSVSTSDNLFASALLHYRLSPDLQLRVHAGYTFTTFKDRAMTPPNPLSPFSESDSILQTESRGSYKVKLWNLEPQLNFEKKAGNHSLSFLIGISIQRSRQKKYLVTAAGRSATELNTNLTAEIERVVPNKNKYSYASGFMRLGYDYKEKYVLNLTGRCEGSSKFPSNQRYTLFGAVGMAWLFSKEPFIANNLHFLTLGKLRASIGTTGNDQIGDNQFINTYTVVQGSHGSSGLLPTKGTNLSYGWETINKAEVGIELNIRNVIFLEGSYYKNWSGNQLVKSPLPAFTGSDWITRNIPIVIVNKGFELTVQTINIKSKNWKWESSFNISFPKNELKKYPGISSSTYNDKAAIGYPLSIKQLYEYKQIDPVTGRPVFENKDKDPDMNKLDKVPVFIGPKYHGGISNIFSCNGFTLELLVQIVNQKAYDFGSLGTPGRFRSGNANLTDRWLNRWKKPGDQKPYSRLSGSNMNEDADNDFTNQNQSTERIKDGSFIRLKNVSLSWSLPEKVTQTLALDAVSFHLQAQNLFTRTKFSGLDPETAQFLTTPSLPSMKFINFTIKISI